MKKQTQKYLIGIDEVGRGPIAGPVTIGAFCVERTHLTKVKKHLKGITDSKQLSSSKREYFFELVKELSKKGLCQYVTVSISARQIDTKGISWAITSALRRALKKLSIAPEDSYIYLDGSLYAPEEYIHQETIIKGDVHNQLIATASVIAKVTRDRMMVRYAKNFPEYHFEKHKGYGTKQHYEAIRKHGLSEIHRKMWIKS